ncbi:MAG: winged helix-turn-helix transcriptional regulator [Clostridium sp.]|nr:winged helix-turn-helix transcriptional regulator [Clostridium sp.]
MENQIKALENHADLLKALGHPVSLCIIQGLIRTGGCHVSHMIECLGLPQSTISQHLQTLKHAGIIEGTRQGLSITYRVIHPMVPSLIELIYQQEEI